MLNYILRKITKPAFKSFPLSDHIVVSSDLVMGRNRLVNIQANNTAIEIQSNVVFREFCNLLVYSGGNLKIGKNVFFNNYCSINCLGNISIGSETLFGEGVKVYDHNHKYSFVNEILKVEANEFKVGKIVIGNNCWIGSNVTILNNVEIGDNVIIGANCLITKSIPSNTIVKHSESLIIENYK